MAILVLSLRRSGLCRTTGFTLIELMIVMSLIVVLAGITISVNANAQIRAREAVLKEDLFRLRDAIDQYYSDKESYPSSLDDLVSDRPLHELVRHLADRALGD
jgi:general secretion pathway protein G